jgi:soluble lytic murein transglycosylase-like protein
VTILVAALLAITGIASPAEASAPAVRLDPPTVTEAAPVLPEGSSASAGGRCTGWVPLLERYNPGWSTQRMAAVMYRESRCDPTARNRSSSATGLLQLLASHCPWLARQMGTWCTRDRLTDPVFNVQAAAVLFDEQGMSAWAATS